MTSIIQNIASNSEDEYRQLPHNLDAEQQLLDGSYKPLITREQQKQVIAGIESEIAIWNYIAKVTEFNF